MPGRYDEWMGDRVLDLLIVGAGPAGLATGIAAKQQGLDYLVIDKGGLVAGIFRFPTNMVFFTTPELLEIGGLPFVTPYDKPTRLEALRYYRRVADTFDQVLGEAGHRQPHLGGSDHGAVSDRL